MQECVGVCVVKDNDGAGRWISIVNLLISIVFQ